MGSIIITLLVVTGLVAAFLVVYNLIGPRRDSLSRKERADYERLVTMRENLTSMAAEHQAFGDPFATIVADEVRNSRRSQEL